jgi:hypothetical protein
LTWCLLSHHRVPHLDPYRVTDIVVRTTLL